MSDSSEPVIYQLKVVLLGISPMIWRRLLVKSDSTIEDLHYIIQIAMGWEDIHNLLDNTSILAEHEKKPCLEAKKLSKMLEEFRTYILNNGAYIPNYGERWRYGEAISTGFVESTVNQVISKRFVKKQQMRWTPVGAHLLLQVRTLVLNGELRDKFQQWYPGLAAVNLCQSL